MRRYILMMLAATLAAGSLVTAGSGLAVPMVIDFGDGSLLAKICRTGAHVLVSIALLVEAWALWLETANSAAHRHPRQTAASMFATAAILGLVAVTMDMMPATHLV